MKLPDLLSRIPARLRFIVSLFLTLVLLFVVQKVVFMLYNGSMAEGAPFFTCVAALWHGLGLDIATACYLMIVPVLVTLVSLFVRIPMRRVLVPYYILIALVFTLAFAVDLVLYSYWGSKPDANDLIYAEKPKEMLAGLPVWFTLLGFAVVALLVWGCVLLLRRVTPDTLQPVQRKPKYKILYTLSFIPLFGLIFLGMRGSVTESTANPSFAYFSTYQFCNHSALNPTFNMFHSLFKVQNLAKEFEVMPQEEADALLGDVLTPDQGLADSLLRVERPNVLLIIWEGGGTGMVGNDRVGPNLQRIIKESVCFSNCQAGNYRTDRGLVAVLSGWMGLPTATLMKRPDLCRNLPSLASSLKSHGYHTSMTFGGDIDYTNMRMYFMETGFTTVKGGETFPSELYSSAWGVPDERVLTESLIPAERPFFSTVLTLSSHEPWDVDYHRLPDPRENAFAYTDSCLGAFVDKLKATPLWDSLLVVIVPDHGACFGDAHSTADPRVAHIPLVWTGGAIRSPRTIDCLMSQSDLAATLLAQMGVDISDFVLSRNVMSPSYEQRCQFALHVFKNGCNLITPSGVSTYDCVDRSLTVSADSLLPSAEAQTFIEALLQHVYATSAALADR